MTDPVVDVVLVGTPFAPIGMGEHIRAPFRALRSVGARVRVHDVLPHASSDDAELQREIGPHLADALSPSVNIFCINGNQVREVFGCLRPPLPSTSHNIIWPAWELSTYPDDWAREFGPFHEVWVASRFTEAALRAAVSIPVSRMPFGIGPRLARFLGRRHFGIPEAPFVFLFMFDFLSFVERKNPFAVLEAFRRLQRRRPGPAARLVIKLNNSAQRPRDHRRFLDAIAAVPDRVIVIDRVMTDDEIKNLVRCCDCFVSLHRSEGFGFALAEAMYFRKPVIATGYSGNLDFMSADTSALLPYHLVPVPPGTYPYADGQVWAEPDLDAAVDAMLRLLDDPPYRHALGLAASRHVRTHLSYQAVGLRYLARLGDIVAGARPVTPVSSIQHNGPHPTASDVGPVTPSMDHPGRLPSVSRFRVHASGRAVGYVPDQPGILPERLPARVVAFYLPRFYPDREADGRWGSRLTEWAIVARALPQIEGQSQPRLPGELGFYDLRVEAVHRRQLDLARQYGLSGFCYSFYWCAGKSFFEIALRRHLDDPSFTLPFCLNWANEDWTSGADGRDNVLLSRQHSSTDDLAFADYVLCYLRDPRYFRVGGRPLLIVNRPDLLPDPPASAQRWREHFRTHGIGEVLLAFLDAVDRGAPSRIGFDAAIEFGPDQTVSPEVSTTVRRVNPEFAGRAYDWRCFPQRSASYEDPPFLHFRSVNPGWDTGARNPGRSDVFLNTSPRGYETWLTHALHDAVRRFPQQDHRLVFVNAWNKWAEAAYLEPDARLGYAYLAATRRALVRVAAAQGEEPAVLPARRPICVVVHAYYPELLDEILALLTSWQPPYRLILTTAPDTERAVRARLVNFGHDVECRVYENRGRDILPFLRVANELADSGEQLVLKLHTKRSLHRVDGDGWRRDLLAKLIGAESEQRCHAAFAAFPRLGMIAPHGHIFALRFYWSTNRENVHYLCRRLGIAEADPEREVFTAGSMFWARLDALRPLLDLHLDEAEFEAERGQVDGTMAHAVERVMTLAVKQSGMYLASTSEPAEEVAPS